MRMAKRRKIRSTRQAAMQGDAFCQAFFGSTSKAELISSSLEFQIRSCIRLTIMVNIFKQKLDDTPREVINWKLGFVIFTFGLMGGAPWS